MVAELLLCNSEADIDLFWTLDFYCGHIGCGYLNILDGHWIFTVHTLDADIVALFRKTLFGCFVFYTYILEKTQLRVVSFCKKLPFFIFEHLKSEKTGFHFEPHKIMS